jgi:hypothetical protein
MKKEIEMLEQESKPALDQVENRTNNAINLGLDTNFINVDPMSWGTFEAEADINDNSDTHVEHDGRGQSLVITDTSGFYTGEELNSAVRYVSARSVDMKDGHIKSLSGDSSQSSETGVGRVATNDKTGKTENGAVEVLTGSRSERAREIIEARAARAIGTAAIEHSKTVIANYENNLKK